MLETLLKTLKNWFRVRDNHDGKYSAKYTISGGRLTLPFLVSGQYFRIIGSVLNDGLYIYGDEIRDGDGKAITLSDETFDGTIWALAVPKAVVELSEEIAKWQEKYGEIVNSPYTSESYFGQYSYSKQAAGSSGGWEDVFAKRLNAYRKISED